MDRLDAGGGGFFGDRGFLGRRKRRGLGVDQRIVLRSPGHVFGGVLRSSVLGGGALPRDAVA